MVVIMSVFTKAVEQLQLELVGINKRAMKYSIEGLSVVTDSTQPFADPEQLPEDLRNVDPSSYVLAAESPYSTNVLQAAWNIAFIAGKIAQTNSFTYGPTLLYYKSDLELCFNYLDNKGQNAPHIIDDTTYQAGIVLHKFLLVATTNPEARKLFPGMILDTLQEMGDTLKERLTVYSAHTPTALASTTDLLKLRDKQFKSWDDEAEKLQIRDFLGNASPLHKYAAMLRGVLPSDPQLIPAIKDVIEELRQSVVTIKQRKQEFSDFNEQWKHNNHLSFPDEIVTSNYIEGLCTPTSDEDTISNWLNIRKDGCTVLNIREKITEKHHQGEQEVGVATAFIKIFEEQILALEERCANILALTPYEEELSLLISQTPDLPLPEFIVNNDNLLTYTIDLSTAEDMSARLEADKLVYAALMPKLDAYVLDLDEHQKTLEQEELALSKLLPPDDQTKLAFKQAQEQACVQLMARIVEVRKHRGQIDILSSQASEAQERVISNLGKFSQANREKLLIAVGERIEQTSTVSEEAFHSIGSKKHAVRALLSTPDKDTLSKLLSQDKIRVQALELADQTLAKFDKAIRKSQSLYIPADKIPKEQLKHYLECNDTVSGFIDELYEQELNTRPNWLGVNLTHTLNVFKHHTSLFASEFDYNMDDILDYIRYKREQIKVELSIDITATEVPVHQSPAENNRYTLQAQYQQELAPSLDRANRLHLLNLGLLVSQLDHRQALLQQDLHTLAFQLADVEEAQTAGAKLMAELDPLNTEQTLALLKQNTTLIAELGKWATQEPSTEELHSRISVLMAEQTKRWQQLEVQQQNIHGIEEKLQVDIAQLRIELKDLVGQKTAADSQYDALQALLQSLKLTSLLTANAELISTVDPIINTLNDGGHHLLLASIDNQLQKLAEETPFLSDIANSAQAVTREKGEQIQAQFIVLSQAKTDLKRVIYNAAILKAESFTGKLNILNSTFFGEGYNLGVFEEYLQERALTFFVRDLLSSVAALVLGCFGYKTEASIRAEFISDLETEMDHYREDDPDCYKDIQELINTGLTNFAPRANKGQADYEKSLHAKLSQFQQDLQLLHPVQNDLTDEEQNSADKSGEKAPFIDSPLTMNI